MTTNPKVHQLLHALGVTEKENRIFTTLFSLGTATAAQIARQANFKRPNTYNLLKSLENHGIITSFIENKKTFFRALGVDALENYLQEQINSLREQQETISEVRVELDNLKQGVTAYETKDVRVFEGRKPAMQVWYDMLRLPEGETIYDIEGSHHLDNVSDRNQLTHKDVEHFAEIRVKKKIRVHFISTSPSVTDTALTNKGLMRYTDAIYIHETNWPHPIEMGAYGNKFYFSTHEMNPRAFLIENKYAADAFKDIFRKLQSWALSLTNSKHVVRD